MIYLLCLVSGCWYWSDLCAGRAEDPAGGGPGGRGRGIHRPQVSPLPETEYTVEEEREEKTKVVAALWDVLECRTSHLAAG